ncbi:MAG: hypothetical protein AAFR61_01775 [Bacteroidota bacterium]
MKRLNPIVFFLMASFGFFVSCDNTVPVDPNGPTLEFLSTSAVADGDTVMPGTAIQIQISAQAGDGPMTRIEVQEDGAAMETSRLMFDGFAAGSNPSPLGSGDATSLNWTIDITTDTERGVLHTYTVIVTDSAGLTDEFSFDLFTMAGIPVTSLNTVLLLNAGGPAGTGGVDLHTGTGTGSEDAEADIKDKGLDLGASSNAENWYQQIMPVQATGSDLRLPAAGFEFDNVTVSEEIAVAFDAATSINESDKVAIGDVFLVLSQGTYFAIKVTNITVTVDDNADNYELTVLR